jgi:hypothetical protein
VTKRKANLEAMSPEALDNLAAQAGAKINEILQKAKRDCDKLLSKMGLELDLGYELKSKGDDHKPKE